MIIGISGRIGSGKDTLAKFIQALDSSWEVKKFAGKLKQIASLLTGVPVKAFESQSFKKEIMPAVWGGMTYREFLQKLGTDAIRDGLHTNTWVNALFADYKLIPRGGDDQPAPFVSYPNWLITDVRFPNEAEAVKKYGGIMVRLKRNELPAAGLHPSETALDDYPFDLVIDNNGDLDKLRRAAHSILIHLKQTQTY